jgi:hypothetical protein
VDNPTAIDATDGLFKVRGVLVLTSPNGLESWDVASQHNITWTRTGSILNVKLEYSTDGGGTYPNLVIASTDAFAGTYLWTVPDNLSTQVRVKVTDTSDSTVYDISNANFTIKGALTLNTPNGAEDMVVGTSYEITWTRFGSIQNVKLEYSVQRREHISEFDYRGYGSGSAELYVGCAGFNRYAAAGKGYGRG